MVITHPHYFHDRLPSDLWTYEPGAYPWGVLKPPLISIVVIFQPIILYTINPPLSDMLVPAPSTPKYIPLPIKRAGVWDASLAPLTD